MTMVGVAPQRSICVTEAYSVYDEGELEALRHKWIESERARCDLGESAMRQWVRDHWHGYLRARWIEHMQGARFWKELDRGDFGLLKRDFRDHALLVDRIVDRLKAGQENLQVIQWALDWKLPMDTVLDILEALDVNRCHLSHRFQPH
jgi:hypothetical protein